MHPVIRQGQSMSIDRPESQGNDVLIHCALFFLLFFYGRRVAFFYFCMKTTLFPCSPRSCASTHYSRVEVGTVDFS